jgi:1-acyl-sn-glycerol-3-phosphate acyltransferase
LLYRLLKIIARPAIRIYCRKVIVNKPEWLRQKGPLLLAANHPNSFLDSIILDTILQEPCWSLARGDAFRNKFYTKLLTLLRILPVYRTSEGVENLAHNYTTFDSCIRIFQENGVVTIFSEGKCINEWHLRPLKKGTARLAIKAWDQSIPLTVVPVGINYSSFHLFGKNVFINFGSAIRASDLPAANSEGIRHQLFNTNLNSQLGSLVFEIDGADKKMLRDKLSVPVSQPAKLLLIVPAFFGWLLHAPLYYPVKWFTRPKTKGNDHYDSVLVAILFLTYPIYLLAVALIAAVALNIWLSVLLFLSMPLSARAAVIIKKQTA